MDEFEPLDDVSKEYYIDSLLNDSYIRSRVTNHNIETLQPFILNYIELILSNNIIDSNIYTKMCLSLSDVINSQWLSHLLLYQTPPTIHYPCWLDRIQLFVPFQIWSVDGQ